MYIFKLFYSLLKFIRSFMSYYYYLRKSHSILRRENRAKILKQKWATINNDQSARILSFSFHSPFLYFCRGTHIYMTSYVDLLYFHKWYTIVCVLQKLSSNGRQEIFKCTAYYITKSSNDSAHIYITP